MNCPAGPDAAKLRSRYILARIPEMWSGKKQISGVKSLVDPGCLGQGDLHRRVTKRLTAELETRVCSNAQFTNPASRYR